MEEKKTKFLAWVKAHKKQLLLSGISVITIIGVIIGLKNKETIINLWNSLEKSITNVSEKQLGTLNIVQVTSPEVEEVIPVRSYTSPKHAFDVSRHVRNLSDDRRHSAEKAAEAEALGITLLPNQTLVNTYTKCAA